MSRGRLVPYLLKKRVLICNCEEESIKKFSLWKSYAQDYLNLRAPIGAVGEGTLMRANDDREGHGRKLLLVVLFRPGKGVQSLLNFEPEQPQALSLMQY